MEIITATTITITITNKDPNKGRYFHRMNSKEINLDNQINNNSLMVVYLDNQIKVGDCSANSLKLKINNNNLNLKVAYLGNQIKEGEYSTINHKI